MVKEDLPSKFGKAENRNQIKKYATGTLKTE
jgi:hypothetical protein